MSNVHLLTAHHNRLSFAADAIWTRALIAGGRPRVCLLLQDNALVYPRLLRRWLLERIRGREGARQLGGLQ